jgi:hypothetical protein
VIRTAPAIRLPRIRRVWAMPSPETFGIKPIAALLDRWLRPEWVVIDPFARNSTRGTIRNDLNPKTAAEFHMTAQEFVKVQRSVRADAVLFDPPYSPRQISEVYQSIGRKCSTEDTQNARLYAEVKTGLAAMLKDGGIAICCGWNSSGFGKRLDFELLELLLICHGSAHNDTIVTVERKAVRA